MYICIRTYIHTEVSKAKDDLALAETRYVYVCMNAHDTYMYICIHTHIHTEVSKAKDALALAETRYVYVCMYV